MPIINGKKRYLPEETEKAPAEKKRYTPPAPVPREPVKRYVKGEGPQVAKVVNQDATLDLVGSYEFTVKINAINFSFNKVSNLESKTDVELFVEGGNNDYPIIKRKPKQRPDVIVFEKGIVKSTVAGALTSLKNGMKLSNIIILVKKNGKNVKSLCVTEGIIVSKKYGDLDAGSSRLLVERLEVAHTGITEVPV